MARNVEDKIVKLSMDNKDLVSKAKESSSIFTKLTSLFKKSDTMSMDKSTNSLSKFNAEAKRTNLDTLKDATAQAGEKLTAMGVIGATALMNITNRAVDAGLALTKSLTLDGIMDGFQEYELKMGSIQTILANTARHGTTLKEVSANLDELNTYADKTIYNFGDMTRNIGLFTNAGIKIEDATAMIKGFSNEAATSGTNAQQASGAAYQLSQALSAGTIRLMDWRSLQNVGMGNKNMQEGLIEIAQAMGKFTDETTTAEAASKDFNSSLEDKWLTADVMENYLKIQAEGNENVNRSMMKQLGLSDQQIEKFIKQQRTAEEAATKVRTFSQLIDTAKEAIGSGWTETFEMIIGDFDTATELWTGVNNVLDDIIANSSKARNDLVKGVIDLGGRQFMIEALTNVFKSLFAVVGAVRNAFLNVFPPASAVSITNMIQRFRNLTEAMIPSEATVQKLTTIFQGLFSIISIGIKFVKMIANAFLDMIPKGLGGDLMDLLVHISELIIKFDQTLTPTNAFSKALEAISSVIRNTIGFIVDMVKGVGNLGGILGSIGGKIGSVFKGLGSMISGSLGEVKFTDVINTAGVGGILVLVKKLKDSFKGFDKLTDSFTGIFDAVKDGISNLGGITDALDNMTKVINIGSIVAIAGAVLMIATSFRMIANLPAQDIFKSLETLGLALAGLGIAMAAISKINVSSGFKTAVVVTAIANSLLIMSVAVKVMSSIDPEGMATALVGLAGSMATMVLAMKALSRLDGNMMGTAVALGILAGGLLVISGAMKVFASISWEGIAKGLVSMGAVLTALGLFSKAVQKSKLSMATATSVVLISGAMVIMAGAIAALGYMDTDAVIQGGVAIGAILAALSIFTKIVSGSQLMSAAVGLTVLSGGLIVMSGAIRILGGMAWQDMAQGLIGLAGGLTVMVVALKFASGSVGGAIALSIAAGAIALFAPAVMMLGQLSLGQVAVGLIAIAGTFAIVAGAAMLLGPASLALIPFALAIAAVSLAVGAAGVLLLGFAAALTALAGLTVAGIASIIGSLGLLIAGLTTLVPQMVELGVAILRGLIDGINQIAPQLIETAFNIVDQFMQSALAHVPNIIQVGVQLITNIMTGLAQEMPNLMEAAAQLIISLIAGLANTIRENNEVLVAAVLSLTEAILETIITALEGIVTTMFGWIPGVGDAAKGVGDAARNGLRSYFNDAITTADAAAAGEGFNQGLASKAGGANAAGSTVAGAGKAGLGSQIAHPEGGALAGDFVTGVNGKGGAATTAGTGVAQKGKGGLGSQSATREGSALGGEFVTGVSGKGGAANSAGSGIANRAKGGMSSVSSHSVGASFGQGFASGISSMVDTAVSAASNLASKAMSAIKGALDINSPSRKTRQVGNWFGEGFIIGTDSMGNKVYKSARAIGEEALTGISDGADNVAGIIDDIIDLNPVITPEIDMKNVKGVDIADYIPLNFSAPDPNNGTGTNGPVTININGYNKSPRELADEIEKIIVRR